MHSALQLHSTIARTRSRPQPRKAAFIRKRSGGINTVRVPEAFPAVRSKHKMHVALAPRFPRNLQCSFTWPPLPRLYYYQRLNIDATVHNHSGMHNPVPQPKSVRTLLGQPPGFQDMSKVGTDLHHDKEAANYTPPSNILQTTLCMSTKKPFTPCCTTRKNDDVLRRSRRTKGPS